MPKALFQFTGAWDPDGNPMELWDCGNCAGGEDDVLSCPFNKTFTSSSARLRVQAGAPQSRSRFLPRFGSPRQAGCAILRP